MIESAPENLPEQDPSESQSIELESSDEVVAAEFQPSASMASRQEFKQNSIRSDIWLHSIFLLIALGVIAMSFLMQRGGPEAVYLPGADIPMPPSCAANYVLGVPCPGCGLTRSFISISSGDFKSAWSLNPASFLMYAFVFGQIPWRMFQLSRVLRGRWSYHSNWLYAVPTVLAAALILQWIWRLSTGEGI